MTSSEGETRTHLKITLNHGASQKELLTKLKVNKMFMSGTQSFIWFRIWLNNIYTRNRGTLPETLSASSPESVVYPSPSPPSPALTSPGLLQRRGNKFKHVHINVYFDFCREPQSFASVSTAATHTICPRPAHLVVQFYELWNADVMTEDLLTVCMCECVRVRVRVSPCQPCVRVCVCAMRHLKLLHPSLDEARLCCLSCSKRTLLLHLTCHEPLKGICPGTTPALESNCACSALVIPNWIH